MEAPLHQFPIPPPLPLPLPHDTFLQQTVSASALMMAAAAGAGAGNNKAPPLAAGPGPGREQCPRCASRDTKFCYYNNYNTAQPRHFCRACRRYWTLGGSLRNVPVGGSTRKRTRRPVRPTRAMAAAAVMATPSPTAGSDCGSNPFATSLLQGAAGGGGGFFLLSSLMRGLASSPLLALGAMPLLEGRLGFDDLGLGEAAAAAALGGGAGGDLAQHHHHQQLLLSSGGPPLLWPAASTTVLEGEGDNYAETTTTKWKAASSSVFPYPPATALWQQELAATAPAVGAGGLAASHLLL